MKICTRCTRELLESDFYKDDRGGLRSWCKFCHQEVSSAYQRKDKEGARRRNRKYRDSNPFKLDTHRAHRRALKYGVISTLTDQEWKEIFQSNDACSVCGVQLTLEVNKSNTLSLDHRIPLNRGGNNTKENCIPACWNCNRSKGDRTEKEFRDWIKRVYDFQVSSFKN